MDTASPLADTRRARDFASLYEPPRINGNFTGKHILTVEQFSRKDLQILFDASTSLKKRSRNPRRVMRACRPVSAAQGCMDTPLRPKPCCRKELERTAGAVDLVACGGILDGASWRACPARAAQYWSALVWRGPLAAALILREGRHGE